MKKKIYCVEDDETIQEMLIYALQTSDFEAEGFESAKNFYQKIEENIPDLILLDIMLPDEDGFSILKKLKENPRTKKIPVILLTAKSSEYDKVMGLDIGADDYVTKPFGVLELLSRIKAVLRRSSKEEQRSQDFGETMIVGNITLDNKKRTVLIDNIPIFLTYKEFELLKFMMKNKGIVLTREQLLNRIWGYDYEGESRTVDVHMASLRQKLGNSNILLKTVRGVGYQMRDEI